MLIIKHCDYLFILYNVMLIIKRCYYLFILYFLVDNIMVVYFQPMQCVRKVTSNAVLDIVSPIDGTVTLTMTVETILMRVVVVSVCFYCFVFMINMS